MVYFSITDLSRITGITQHTLRNWHAKHHLLQPAIAVGKHPKYGNGVLKKLLCVALLHDDGMAMETLAAYTTQEMERAVAALDVRKKTILQFTRHLLFEALELNKERFSLELDEAIKQFGFDVTIETLCYPLLQKLEGLMDTKSTAPTWYNVAHYIIQHKMIAATESLPPASVSAPQIVLFAPHSERLSIPLFFIYYLLRKGGWSTIFLGSGVKLPLLQPFVLQGQITHVFVYANGNDDFGVDDYFSDLCKIFTGKTVIATGKATRLLKRNFTNLNVLQSDAEVRQFATRPNLTLV